MRIILFLLLILPFTFSLSAQKDVVVVIDAGHGGKDPGHLSHNAALKKEKVLNLKIAFLLGEYIEKYLQHVTVIYTRTDDTYPSLDDRVSKANSNKADYFLSIHCNGNDRKSVRGTESHVHTMDLKKSVALAREIETQFSKRAGRKSRGVKDMRDLHHTLQVLKYTNMTSVLVECGFITNTREANYLNSTYGQEIIASAIFRGFRATIEKEFPSTAFRKKASNNTNVVTAQGDYTIQIMSSIQPVNEKDASFKRLKMPVSRTKLNTANKYKYIYTVGIYASKKGGREDLTKVQSRGYKDAILIRH